MLISRTMVGLLVGLLGALAGCAEKASASGQRETAVAQPGAAAADPARVPGAPPAGPAARPAPVVNPTAGAWTDVKSVRELDQAMSASKVSVVLVTGESSVDDGPVRQAIGRLLARLASGGQVVTPYSMAATADGSSQWRAARGIKADMAVVFVGGGSPPSVLAGDLSEAQLARAFVMRAGRGGGAAGAPGCGGGGVGATKCGCR